MQNLIWTDAPNDLGAACVSGQTCRTLWHDGDQFVCNWDEFNCPLEQWILDPVPDLAAAKAVVESWETPEGWEDDDS